MNDKPEVDAIIKQYITEGTFDSPGCSLAIDLDGATVYKRGYGMADLDHGIENTASTVFNAASLAKQFTAMSVLLLSDEIAIGQKKIKLDEDVRDYIDELSGLDRKVIPKITIRYLLHHISGIRDMLVLLTLAGWRWGDDVITSSNVLGFVRRMRSVTFPPGTDAPKGLTNSYSNTNYFLAGEIVRRVSGMSLSDFAAQNIFTKLGMKRTRFAESHGEIFLDRAYGYRRPDPSKKRFEMRMPTYDFTGPANLYTTVEDLILWGRNYVTGTVGGQDSLVAMRTTHKFSDGYGLGLYVGDNSLRHNGTHPGYRSYLVHYRKEKLTLALLCNLELPDEIITGSMASVATAVLGKIPYDVEEEDLAEFKHVNKIVFPLQKVVEVVPHGGFEQYCGEYYSEEIDSRYVVTVDKAGAYLVIERHTYPPTPLNYIANDEFWIERFTAVLSEVSVKFWRGNVGSGQVVGLRLNDGRRLVNFEFVKQD